MMSRSVLVGPRPQDLGALAQALRIAPADLLRFGDDSDYEFFQAKRNAGLFTPVSGDFAASCDLYLFAMTEDRLHGLLRQVSFDGRRVAIPLEDAAETGLQDGYRLYENGQAYTAQIVEDELLEEVTITQKTALAGI